MRSLKKKTTSHPSNNVLVRLKYNRFYYIRGVGKVTFTHFFYSINILGGILLLKSYLLMIRLEFHKLDLLVAKERL